MASSNCPAADLGRTLYSEYILSLLTIALCVYFDSLIQAQFSVNCLNPCQFCMHFGHLEHMLSVRQEKSGNNTM